MLEEIEQRYQQYRKMNIIDKIDIEFKHGLSIEIYQNFTDDQLLQRLNMYYQEALKGKDRYNYETMLWKIAILFHKSDNIELKNDVFQVRLKVNQKITISNEILKEQSDFPYCGIVGMITDLDDCKDTNKILIDFGSSILCVERKYVKGIRE